MKIRQEKEKRTSKKSSLA